MWVLFNREKNYFFIPQNLTNIRPVIGATPPQPGNNATQEDVNDDDDDDIFEDDDEIQSEDPDEEDFDNDNSNEEDEMLPEDEENFDEEVMLSSGGVEEVSHQPMSSSFEDKDDIDVEEPAPSSDSMAVVNRDDIGTSKDIDGKDDISSEDGDDNAVEEPPAEEPEPVNSEAENVAAVTDNGNSSPLPADNAVVSAEQQESTSKDDITDQLSSSESSTIDAKLPTDDAAAQVTAEDSVTAESGCDPSDASPPLAANPKEDDNIKTLSSEPSEAAVP